MEEQTTQGIDLSVFLHNFRRTLQHFFWVPIVLGLLLGGLLAAGRTLGIRSRLTRLLLGFLFALLLLKAVLAVVHDLADRRLRLGSNQNQIHILVVSQSERLASGCPSASTTRTSRTSIASLMRVWVSFAFVPMGTHLLLLA